MKPYHADEWVTLYHGDALAVLSSLPDGSVDCCVTSPPYFGLRDYGEEGQYGLEASPAEYVETMRALFAEVRRVLADDGTLWLNLGDSYVSMGGAGGRMASNLGTAVLERPEARDPKTFGRWNKSWGLPAKNLLGIPWRTAFALQDDGWILRNDIIWSKPNTMPESVTDRLSSRHEHLFMFAKSRRYWFDLDPIREPSAANESGPKRKGLSEAWNSSTGLAPHMGHRGAHDTGRNPGDVWSIPTQPFAEAHFAVMPQALAERAILAGCPPRKCSQCGHTPRPVKERGGLDMSRPQARRAVEIAEGHGLTEAHFDAIRSAGATDAGKAAVTQSGTGRNAEHVALLAAHAKSVLKGYYREFLLDRPITTGWTECGHGKYHAGTVLDPFSGSGTTGLAANKHGRKYVGIDLNPDYLDLSLRTRFAQPGLDLDGGAA